MASQVETNNLPSITGLDRIDIIEGQFFRFLGLLDKQEQRLFENVPFPYEYINEIALADYSTICHFDNLDEHLVRIANAIWRVDTHINRIDQILRWIDCKIASIIANLPRNALEFMERDEKLARLAKSYPVVQYLVNERHEKDRYGIEVGYVSQQLHWRNINKNLERIEKIMWLINERRSNGKT